MNDDPPDYVAVPCAVEPGDSLVVHASSEGALLNFRDARGNGPSVMLSNESIFRVMAVLMFGRGCRAMVLDGGVLVT